MPYFKSKLHSIYNKEREARLQASLWGDDNERFDNAEIYDVRGDLVVPTRALRVEASVRARVINKFQKIVGACYPWLHASSEGINTLHPQVFVVYSYFELINFGNL